ncbi:dihydrofolate reductase family protein [Nocardioidaceae bacterium]|nr:dihydrofolate reductase family protein [Nocardioidaceae bacterium]
MQVLLNTTTDVAGADLTEEAVAAAYATERQTSRHGDGSWWRSNFISSVDGAITGADGLSVSIRTDADGRVFGVLRDWAEVIVVGAGTAREEEYAVNEKPIVLVSRSAEVPESLQGAERGAVLMATVASSDGLADARRELGEEHVVVCGEDDVDASTLRTELTDRGWHRVLVEGGPHVLGDALDAGALDEVCASVAPKVVAGEHSRMASGPDVSVDLRLGLLLEENGTLLARWLL